MLNAYVKVNLSNLNFEEFVQYPIVFWTYRVILRDLFCILFKKTLSQRSLLKTLESIRKNWFFWWFQGVLRPKKPSNFRKCGWREKSSLERAQIYFFHWFSRDILFSSLVYFALFDSYFCLFVCFFVCLLFFEIKNGYSDAKSTMQAGEW